MFTTRKLLTVLLISIFSDITYAQTVGQQNDLDEQYTPKGTGPLSSESKSNNISNSYNADYPKNIVKFTPTSLVRSLVCLSYERNLTDNFSLIGGLGLNYNKDIIFSILGSEFDFLESSSRNSSNLGLLSPTEIIQNSTHKGMSPNFQIATKFIYESNFWDSYSYLEFQFFNYSNKVTYNGEEGLSNELFTNGNDVKFNYSLYNLKWGAHFFTEGSIKTSHELFFSIGLRTTKYNNVYRNYDNDYNSTTYNKYINQVSSSKSSMQGLTFFIGYSFGIGF